MQVGTFFTSTGNLPALHGYLQVPAQVPFVKEDMEREGEDEDKQTADV